MNAAAERGETALAEATRAQTLAARPDVSVWVSANAGSGKTRVLTNRVARLLLAGADPSRILCLTYTKAAAAEMQNRLFLMLGDWTMAEDEALRGALAALLSEGEAAPDGAALAAARRLFARALETPGGLRIQTIHAFCEGLLSRFPLEAGVSPQFEVIDEAAADALIADARDEAVTRAVEADPALAPALDLVMARLKEGGFDELIAAMRAKRGAYESAGGEDALARFLGAEPGRGVGALIDAWAAESDRAALRSMASAFAQSEKKSSAPAARALAIAADESASPAAAFEALAAALLKQDGAPKTHNFPAKDVTVSDPTLEPRLRALQEALSALREAILAAERFEASAAAARLAGAILSGYQQRKAERAALDYDDLIQSAVGLLTRSEARDWVRYKLDGGVEHILVDEAQDTSPGQWRAIEALSEEFFAGAGVERFGADEETPPQPRTLFAVGDEKQSIYSFQGAAPELLSRKGAAFAAQAEAAGARFERADMATSFRSTPAVLGFVDRVFASAEARRGLSFGPDAASGAPASVRHRAFRSAAPGQVDLWPLLEPAETGEEPPWDEPVDAPPPDDPKARLARLVAEEIVGWIDAEPLPAQGRAIRPGDVLILVRNREPYSSLLIKALKGLGAPVSGADRLSLTEELAVKDLLALGRFCLAPDDDLTVATLLRSPFCDVDEAALFDLAHRRPGRRRLFYELQARRGDRPEYAAAYAFLAQMLRRADFERPYELFSYALGPMDGRRRLLARLGPEAQDPIDELMAEALRFERSGGPSLEAFSLALSQREIEIKREHEQGRDEIRVMTAHGAKGLEAPVVVLPDTCGKPSGGRPGPALLEPSLLGDAVAGARTSPPVWAGRKQDDPPPLAALRAALAEKEAEEHRRLLYVALTRAEDRLLICGAKPGAEPKGAWWRLCEAAFTSAARADDQDADLEAVQDWGAAGAARRVATPVCDAFGKAALGWRLGPASADAPLIARSAATPNAVETPAPWLWRAAEAETAPADIRPSDLGGEDPERTDPGEADPFGAARLDPDSAARRGVLIHRLLERLPAAPRERRAAIAARVIAEEGEIGARFGADALREAEGVLDAPTLAFLFMSESRAEVPFAAVLPALGPGEIHGVIDRVVVSAEEVLIVDYKTGAPAETPPEAYLRQLAVYRAALGALYPDRTLRAALLWTAAPRLERIANAEIDRAFARAAAALDPLRSAP